MSQTGAPGRTAELHPSADEQGACQLCTRDTTGFLAAHHCRVCWRLVCGKCSSSELAFSTSGGGIKRLRVCTHCVTASAQTECATRDCERVFSSSTPRVLCTACWCFFCERCVAFQLTRPHMTACLHCTSWRVLHRSGAPELALERAEDARQRADEARRALAYERRLRDTVHSDGKEEKKERDGPDDIETDGTVPEIRDLRAVLSASENAAVASAVDAIDAAHSRHEESRVAAILAETAVAVQETQRFVHSELTERKLQDTATNYVDRVAESVREHVREGTVAVVEADALHAATLPTLDGVDFRSAIKRVRVFSLPFHMRARTAAVGITVGALLFGAYANRVNGLKRLESVASLATFWKHLPKLAMASPSPILSLQAAFIRAMAGNSGAKLALTSSLQLIGIHPTVSYLFAHYSTAPVVSGLASVLLRVQIRSLARRISAILLMRRIRQRNQRPPTPPSGSAPAA